MRRGPPDSWKSRFPAAHAAGHLATAGFSCSFLDIWAGVSPDSSSCVPQYVSTSELKSSRTASGSSSYWWRASASRRLKVSPRRSASFPIPP